jgi:hypothetical protein
LDRYDDAMRAGIRVLGPLEAEVEGARADLGGPLQRAVLALLLMERGRVVSVDRMIDQLCGGAAAACHRVAAGVRV